MFGYINIASGLLDKEAQNRYRAFYCGLCRTLRDRFGQLGRLTLSNDITFLCILLSSLYENDGAAQTGVCPVHPLRKQQYRLSKATEYAADMNILLAYYTALDDVKDEKSAAKAMQARNLKSGFDRVRGKYPEKCAAIQGSIERINILEAQDWIDIDELCNLSGRILGEVFCWHDDEWREMLYQVGSALGRFIYFMDAYEDYEADVRKKRFNPLIELRKSDDYEELCRQTLLMLAGEATEAFDMLPLEQDMDLMRNVLYSGIWAHYVKMHEKDQSTEKQGESS
ncbi:MAG: hypothetical protein IJ240_00665 [Clostridia bacterium]|nr:hypothetical protein [Clostridia bacterium]